MRTQSKTADKAAQVAATAQNSQTLIHTYGKPITKVKTAFQMPVASYLSKEQIKHTHYWLESKLTPNFNQMIETFRKLLTNAPCAISKESDLKRGFILLATLKAIQETAGREDYFDEVPMDGEHKVIHLSNVTRKINYASLQAMDNLRCYRNAFHQSHFPKRHILAAQLFGIILNLYVPFLSEEEEFCMDALLQLFITYDK